MSEDRILVLVPCYNCAPQVVRVLDQLAALPAGLVEEALVLDNGSRDGTAEAAAARAGAVTGLRVRVARNLENYNLGGSHKAAFAYADAAGFTHVLVLHGDDQGRISEIAPQLLAGEHRRFDALLGSRFMTGAQPIGYSRFRIFGNHVFNLIFSAVCGRRILDLGSGLNIFSRAVFTDPAIARMSDDLRFNVYLVLRLVEARRRFRFFPISWREEDQVSNVKIVSQALRTLAIAVGYARGARRLFAADHRDVPREAYAFAPVEPEHRAGAPAAAAAAVGAEAPGP